MEDFLCLRKKVNRTLAIFITLLVTFVSFSVIVQPNISNVAGQSSPDPEIYKRIYPDSIELGETATIAIWGTNNGADAMGANIHIAFPDNPDSSQLENIESDVSTEYSIYWPGDTMGGNYGKDEYKISYPVAIAYDYEEGWKNGESHYLSVDIKPISAGILTFEVKMTLQAYDDSWYGDPKEDGSETSVKDQQDEYVFVHSIYVAIPESSYFIQLTDTHVNELFWPAPMAGRGTTERFTSMIQKISYLNPLPKFIIISGDLVDWGGGSWGVDSYNAFNNVLSSLDDLNIPVLFAPGNHDWLPAPDELILAGGALLLGGIPLTMFVLSSWLIPAGIDNYHSFIKSNDDYSWDYENYHIVSMNSGHADPHIWDDYCSGLTDPQIDWLENDLDMLDGNDDDQDTSGKLKFVFMHHPYRYLSDNIQDFLDICNEYEVAMILAGHHHQNYELDENFNFDEDDINNPKNFYSSNKCNEMIGPMFAETRDSVDYGYRMVFIKGSDITTSANVFKPTIKACVDCPANLHMYDSNGNHVGYDSSGDIEVDIFDSYYLKGNEIRPQTASVPYGEDYLIEVKGIGVGTFNLTIEYLLEDTESPATIIYRNVPVTSTTSAIIYLNHPYTDYTMYIDGETIQPDEIIGAVLSEPTLPIANAGPDIRAFEGEMVTLDGSGSEPMDGEIIEYKWTFDGYTLYGPNPTFSWYDDYEVIVTLTIKYIITYYEIDDDGNVVERIEIGTKSDTKLVSIINVEPTSSIDRAYMFVDFTLRGAGEKWHNVFWDLYETDWASDGGPLIDSNLIAHLEIERSPGDPDKQSDTVYDVYIDMEKIYYFVATYYPFEDDKPINGQLQGSNPIWIDLTFEDGSTERIHHNFNVEQSMKKDSDHWVHVEPWYIDLSPWFVEHEITFEVSSEDPGTDDETFTMDWDDATPLYIEFYPYRPSGATDPYPSPYDSNEGSYPVDIHDTYYHIYMFEDDFFPELFVMDDDGGSKNFKMDIDAIHTEHIYPVK